MLGEEQWLLERPKDAAMAVNAAASAIGLVGFVAARRRQPMATGAASATAMALLLVYWELMVRYYEDRREQAADD
jgi:phosphoribosylanthranilate isomerase